MPCYLASCLVHCESCDHSCPGLYPEVSCTDSHCLAARLVYLSDIIKCLTSGSVSLRLEARLVLHLRNQASGFLLFLAIIPFGAPSSSAALKPVVTQDWFQWSPSLPVIVSSTVCTVSHFTLLVVLCVHHHYSFCIWVLSLANL